MCFNKQRLQNIKNENKCCRTNCSLSVCQFLAYLLYGNDTSRMTKPQSTQSTSSFIATNCIKLVANIPPQPSVWGMFSGVQIFCKEQNHSFSVLRSMSQDEEQPQDYISLHHPPPSALSCPTPKKGGRRWPS